MPTLSTLSKRLSRLESGGNAPPPADIGDWSEWSGTPLLEDSSWRPYCTLSQFIVGRAALCASWWRFLDLYDYWSRRFRESDWMKSPAARRDPHYADLRAREQSLWCPPENRVSVRSFSAWLYSDSPKSETSDPWRWCNPGTASPYYWPGPEHIDRGFLPITHALMVASSILLVDECGMSPMAVKSATTIHRAAFPGNDLRRLGDVEVPASLQQIDADSVVIPIHDMVAGAKDHGFPVPPGHVIEATAVPIIDVLMAEASGCDGASLRMWPWFPAVNP